MLNADILIALLKHPVTLDLHDSLDSTNTRLKALARQGAPALTLVTAGSQTAGVGRRGRSFFSPPGGLYFSLLVDAADLSAGQLTTLAAVSSLRAIRAVAGVSAGIKWVNDLMLNGRKIGGILCEGIVEGGYVGKAVIGVGINTGSQSFPPELSTIAGSLSAGQEPINREALLAYLINDLVDSLPEVPSHMAEYRKNCLNLGQTVRFVQNNIEYTGTALSVNEEGALLVQTISGLVTVSSGDVSLIKEPGA